MFTTAKRILKDLLHEVARTSELPNNVEPNGRPAGFIPEICLAAFHKLAANAVLELLIYRQSSTGEYEFYYQDRDDKNWHGFCAHGVFVKPNFPQDVVGMAQKLLDREFAGLGLSVKTLQVVAPFLWKDEHPWANPFTLTCVVQLEGGELPITGRWIAVNDLESLPRPTVIRHDDYIRQADYFLRNGALVFTPTQRMGVPGLEVRTLPPHPLLEKA